MRFVIRLLLAITVALAVGFGLSYYALTNGRLFGAVEIGPWTAWPDAGSPAPNPYTRGHITRDAAFQLGRAEGLQFTATADNAGDPLDLDCTYMLTGHVPVSSFWTLMAVGPNWVNLAGPDQDAALRSSAVLRENDGSFRIAVGTALRPGNWMELAGEGPFTLVLSLYDTTALSGFNSADMTLPDIVREACP
ncbi:MAG: DUF1214 domain-containing protein [Devosia sp.]|uniref:DUF1214 domain-containing protein n=1 Tax=Devosia sp. TaxID=1871048 RepID=UPI0024CDCD69|nr:DUF1214 domain-containing protein [Devosia sp.]UYN99684.1 MAG: DUF1214 domain-containing protein [Devosia sp.]